MLPDPTRFCWSCWRAVRLCPPCCISVCRATRSSSTAQHSALRRRNRLRHQRQTHLSAWDRPSPFLVCHASQKDGWLTDDKKRSSVPPHHPGVHSHPPLLTATRPTEGNGK